MSPAFMCSRQGDCDGLLLLALLWGLAVVVGTAAVVGGLTYVVLRRLRPAPRSTVVATAAGILGGMGALLLLATTTSNDVLRSLFAAVFLILIVVGCIAAGWAIGERYRRR
jgi:hypothetical protein